MAHASKINHSLDGDGDGELSSSLNHNHDLDFQFFIEKPSRAQPRQSLGHVKVLTPRRDELLGTTRRGYSWSFVVTHFYVTVPHHLAYRH
jgi:hypothetical protein